MRFGPKVSVLAGALSLTMLGTASGAGHGGKIAYKGPDDGTWVVNADGTGAHELTKLKMPSYSVPAWSPDGRRIAFVAAGSVWVMSADGGNLHRLPHIAGAANLSWSPNGRSFVFEKGDASNPVELARQFEVGRHDIYVTDADGSSRRLLRRDAGEPVWSPNGRTIAYVNGGTSSGNGAGEIWVMNADGGKPRRLTSDPGAQIGNAEPAWSPDGRRIAFVSDRRGLGSGGGDREIYVMNADGSNQQRVTSEPSDTSDYYPS